MKPRQAVEEWLSAMGGASRSELAAREPGRVGPPPFPPVLSSMKILKRRAIPGRQIHAVAYHDTVGTPWFWVVRLIEEDDDSWQVRGGGGGSGPSPERGMPWINYAGCWGKDGLAVGGRVAGSGAATSARLRMGDAILVDDIRNGVVLFVTSEPTAGSDAIIELLTEDGSILWQDQFELDE